MVEDIKLAILQCAIAIENDNEEDWKRAFKVLMNVIMDYYIESMTRD
jgi:hypothetical protein